MSEDLSGPGRAAPALGDDPAARGPLVFREETRDTLDTDAFWQVHGPHVVKAAAVTGAPFFYPVYRWGDLHAFSPLPLLLRKGALRVDPAAEAALRAQRHDVTPPHLFLDRDIRRLGGPPDMRPAITDRDRFAQAMAEAMQADWDAVEAANPGKTNIVLCGGRDSLNVLLLRARNPVVAYSAEPNLPLVRAFVRDNGLDIPVHPLEDRDDPTLRAREIAEACGQVDLVHWKWTVHLRQIAQAQDHAAVFWKGQFADAVLTDYWRSYTSRPGRAYRIVRRAYRKAAPHLPAGLRRGMDRPVLADFRRTIWERGAVMQGAHMGFLRSITDCLFVSAYHGPRTSAVWLAADLPRLTGADLRPAIAACLAGRAVRYPEANPAPPASTFRAGLRSMAALETALAAHGIAVVRAEGSAG